MEMSIEGLSFAYRTDLVLQDISLQVGRGETVGIIGENGAGKSTLLKLMVGLYLNFTGMIRIEEIPVQKKTLASIRQKIGYVFQDSDSQLFMSTAFEDVAFAPRNYGLPEEEAERRAMAALSQVGASVLRDKPIYQMSGGEKKLVSIATVLSIMPEMIIMDEPSAALDPRNRRNLIRLLNSMEISRIIASHDLDFIMDTCSRVILLDHGSILADGETDEILRDQALLEAHGLELPLSLYRSG